MVSKHDSSPLSDVHSEAVQAVLARHVERKMAVPMPSKRRSLVVQTSMDAYTPPGDTCTPAHVHICTALDFQAQMKTQLVASAL